MKAILGLCKQLAQSWYVYGIQDIPVTHFKVALQEKYPPEVVLNTINYLSLQKKWIWSGKYAYTTDNSQVRWEIIMYTSSGAFRNIGVLDNGEIESIFFLKKESC